jgi:hypothetical protein
MGLWLILVFEGLARDVKRRQSVTHGLDFTLYAAHCRAGVVASLTYAYVFMYHHV